MYARLFNRNRLTQETILLCGAFIGGFTSGQRSYAVDVTDSANRKARITFSLPILIMFEIGFIRNLNNNRQAVNHATNASILFGLGFLLGYSTIPESRALLNRGP